jgi:hypothetical protein
MKGKENRWRFTLLTGGIHETEDGEMGKRTARRK